MTLKNLLNKDILNNERINSSFLSINHQTFKSSRASLLKNGLDLKFAHLKKQHASQIIFQSNIP